MKPGNSTKRRWQFSLGALFGVLTVTAFLSAAMAGSFGVPVRNSVMKLATALFVVGAGIVYYALFVLMLCMPVLIAIGCLKLTARCFARQPDATSDDRSPGPEPDSDERFG